MNKMEHFLKKWRRKFLYSITFLFCMILGCMDSGEYRGDDPPFIDPPDPPIILLPEPDAEFRSRGYCWVLCDWTHVEGVQSYEMQIDTTPDLSYTWAYSATAGNPIRLDFYPPVTSYYFRIRAYSNAWTWYTAWSDTRRFYLLPVSGDTMIPYE
jgi:hypothetical protein